MCVDWEIIVLEVEHQNTRNLSFINTPPMSISKNYLYLIVTLIPRVLSIRRFLKLFLSSDKRKARLREDSYSFGSNSFKMRELSFYFFYRQNAQIFQTQTASFFLQTAKNVFDTDGLFRGQSSTSYSILNGVWLSNQNLQGMQQNNFSNQQTMQKRNTLCDCEHANYKNQGGKSI